MYRFQLLLSNSTCAATPRTPGPGARPKTPGDAPKTPGVAPTTPGAAGGGGLRAGRVLSDAVNNSVSGGALESVLMEASEVGPGRNCPPRHRYAFRTLKYRVQRHPLTWRKHLPGPRVKRYPMMRQAISGRS